MIAAEITHCRRDLQGRGLFGLCQPARPWRRLPPERMDLVIVPGLAFDRNGHRLGRGGGYFDRFLEKVPAQVPRIGLAFRFQVVARLPRESHDQPVDRVITD